MLAVVLILKVLVIVLIRREDNVASGDEEEPLGTPTFGNKEAAGTLSPRRRLGTDGETKRSSKRVADIFGGVERVGGREELGTG